MGWGRKQEWKGVVENERVDRKIEDTEREREGF